MYYSTCDLGEPRAYLEFGSRLPCNQFTHKSKYLQFILPVMVTKHGLFASTQAYTNRTSFKSYLSEVDNEYIPKI